jgi:hypothetical protein
MKKIELDNISICEGLNVRVVTINRTLEGIFSCIWADTSESFHGSGICKQFSIIDISTGEESIILTGLVEQFFVLNDN